MVYSQVYILKLFNFLNLVIKKKEHFTFGQLFFCLNCGANGGHEIKNFSRRGVMPFGATYFIGVCRPIIYGTSFSKL